MDEPYDPDTFTFDLPVCFVAVSESGAQRQSFAINDPDLSFPVAANSKGEKCWPLFTDEDLAERFAKEISLPSWFLIKLATVQEFIQFLNEAELVGHKRVLFDTRKDVKGVQSHLIADVRDIVRKRLQP